VKALNEIKGSLGWKVLFAWTGDDPCGDGDIAPWIGITCSPPKETEFRVVTELELIQGMIMGPFPLAVTKLLDLKKLYVSQISSTSVTSFYQHAYFMIWKGSRDVGTRELVSCCQLRSSTKIMSIISHCLKSNRGRQPWEYSLLCSVFH
jgi:hypothetical protein